MTTRYNIPVKVLNPCGEKHVSGMHYVIFRDGQGEEQERVFYSKRNFPYVGEMMVVHSFNEDVARKAHIRLKSLERNTGDILVLPITESDLEEDQARDAESELARILGPDWAK